MRKISSILLFVAACATQALAQSYPVQINTALTPPYSAFLTDYSISGSQRFTTTFLLKDLTATEYKGKLRLTIEGVGITIRTKQNFVPINPITLYGGEALTLYGEDLSEYFNPNNLDFAGISRSQYEKGAKLPEGVYRFTVEMLDYNRGSLVSNKGTAVAWIILNDPPLLNLPRTDAKVKIVDPTNVAFNWTPRHTGSPNSAFTTEYVFKLVEIWPITRNPYDAMLSQQPLYEVTTDYTQIAYGPAEPALIAGRKYAWQVQAKDVEGRDLFKNQGKSEVYVFQFGDALGIPENLSLQTANPSSLIVRWEQPIAGTDAVTYRVRLRPHNNRSHDAWYETTTQDQWGTLSSLQPNTEYEVQVRAEQATQASDYSAVKVFKTAIIGANDFVCKSDVSPPAVPANATPARQLIFNDTIHAAGFDVLVREITANQGGTYTGSGMMIVPWFKLAKVRMTFKNISVNAQHWLTAGEIKSVWNADSKFLVKSVKKVDSTSVVPAVGNVPVTIAATETLIEITGAAIATVSKDGDGNITVYTTDGDKKVLEKGKSYSIADEVGNGYVVDKAGNITKTTAAEARKAAERGDRNYTIALTFNKGNGKFGFDDKLSVEKDKYAALSSYYQQLESGQYIPWKAVTSSASDPVGATLEGTGIDSKKVRFEVNGSPITATNNGNNYTLDLRGGAEGVTEELLALYASTNTSKSDVLGKLNLVSYDLVPNNLIIVPVNDTKLPVGIDKETLNQKLSEIYSQAVASWNVEIKPSIKVTLDDLFDDGESGLLTNYTGDMKKVINAYGNLLDKTYYLFLVTKPKSNANNSGVKTLGYMPRSKQAGFIFVDNLNSTSAVTTIAHEIGHGAFNLKHTFSEFSLTQGTTDNLMDYNNGTALYKYQWDHIHDPQKVIGLFEDDEDGASKSSTDYDDLITYLKEKANKLYGETHKVYGFAYCKKCETESTGKIIDHEAGVRSWTVLQGKKSKCLGALYSIVAADSKSFSGNELNFNQWSEAIYQGGQQEILVALLNDKSNYFNCSEALKDQLKDWDYCSEDPTTETLDKIDDLLRGCLAKEGIYTESGEFDKETIATIKGILSLQLREDENFKVEIDNGNSLEILQSKGLTDPSKANYTISIKKNSSGHWEMSLVVSREYLSSLGLTDSEIDELLKYLEELFRQSQVNFCEGGEIKPGCVSDPLRFLQMINLNLVSLASEGTIHPVMWNPNDGKSGLVKSDFKVHPVVGGSFDGLAEAVTDIPVLVKTVGEIALVEEKRDAFFSLFSKEGLEQMKQGIFKELVSILKEEPKRDYVVSKASVQLALAYYVLLEKAAKSIKEVLEKSKVLAAKIEHTPTLQQYLKKIIKDVPDQAKAKRLENLLNGINSDDLEKLLNKVDPSNIDNLVADLSDDLDLAKKMVGKPELVEGWEVFSKAGRNQLKLDPSYLQKVSDVLNNKSLKALGLNKEKLIDISKATSDLYTSTPNVAKRLDAELFDNLGNLGKVLDQNPGTTLENFDKIISDLSNPSGYGTQKGANWIVKDIAENAEEFAGKKLKFNSTQSVNGTNYYVDAEKIAPGLQNKYIEYKSGPGSIDKENFIREFVKRDLSNSNVTDLSQLQWRIEETASNLKINIRAWLKSNEGRMSLNTGKIINLFDDFAQNRGYQKSIRNIDDLVEFVDTNDSWFNEIFKQL